MKRLASPVTRYFDMASLENIELDDTFVSLRDIHDALECVICLDVSKRHSVDPVYQCENGHILCRICRQKVVDCPICRVPLGTSRNLAVEKVLSICPRSCEFREHGCTLKLNKEAADSHRKICKYKPLRCLNAICSDLIPMAHLVKHMKDVHNVFQTEHFSIHYDNMETYIQTKIQFNPAYFIFDGVDFFTFLWREFRSRNRWTFWLYMVGDPQECKKYKYTVQISSVEYNDELKYSGQPVPVDVNTDQVIKGNRCLTIDDSAIERFCSKDRLNIIYDIQLMTIH